MADRTIRAIITGQSSGAVKAFQDTALAADSAGGKIGDSIDKGSSKAGSALNKLGSTAAGFGLPFAASLGKVGDQFATLSTKGQKFQSTVSEIGKVTAIAGAAGLVAFGGEAIKLGSALQDSAHQLDTSIKASGASLEQWQKPISDAQSKFEALGFTNSQFNDALSRSVIATQNVGKSLSEMGVAADLARAKHIDLSSAVDSVDKALTGNLRPLTQMGISLPIVASSAQKLAVANTNVKAAQQTVNDILAKVPDAANAASAAHGIYEAAVTKLTTAQGKLAGQQSASSDILDALTTRLKGQAADAADTFAGKIGVLKAQAEDLGAQVGTVLIPIIESATGFLAQNKGIVEALAAAIGVVLGAAVVDFAVTKVASFVKGVGSMISALSQFILKVTTAQATVAASDAAIIGENEAAAASMASANAGIAGSFTALLGPIAAFGAAAFAAYEIYQKISEVKYIGPKPTQANNQAAVNAVSNPVAANITSQILGTTGAGKLYSQAQSTPNQIANAAAIKADEINMKGLTGAALTAAKAQLNLDEVQGSAAASTNDVARAQAALTVANAKANVATTANTTATNQNGYSAAANSAAKAVESAANSAAAKAASEHTKALNAQTAAAAKVQAAIDKVTTTIKTMVNDALTKATSALASAQQAFDSFSSSTSSSVTGNLSFGTAESTGQQTGQTFLQALGDQAGQVNDFTSKVQQLLSMGLSKDALSQVLAAGSTAGDDIATQLINGGAAAVAQANQMTAAVQNLATGLGTSAADQFYGAGVSQAQSIVDGITDESKKLAPKLKDASKKIADNLKTQVEVDLKIISAGGRIPKLASGGIVTGPTIALIGEAGPEAVLPLSGSGSSTVSGGQTINITVNAMSPDPQSIVNALRQAMSQNGSLAAQGIR